MDRKNKAMLVAAVGAVLVLTLSTAARCAVSHAAGGDGGESPQERVADGPQEEPEADSPAIGGDAEGAEGASPAGALTLLRSHSWQAEGDAERTVTFRDGAFVESGPGGVTVTAFEVENSFEEGGRSVLEVRLYRDGSAENQSCIIAVEGDEGSLEVSCDGFSNSPSYVQGGGAEAVATSGVTEPYATLIDGKTDELAGAIAQWCRDNAPTATQAAFDGEVFLDVAGGRTVATFTCDDRARTILSVEYAGGRFSVSG